MYLVLFGICSTICAGLYFSSKFKNSKNVDGVVSEKSPEFISFQRQWLFVYLLAMFADWLQGPYVYALYASYGFTSAEIAKLFVAGFGSSMVLGTFVGSLSDKYGRKLMCIVFALCYIVSAITKLSHSFYILFFGRIFSGVATSLLFSAFEAWMVCEHKRRKFSDALLSDTFSKATAGNGLIAVIAGLVSSFLADNYGYVVPFVFAIVPLTILTIPVFSWTENYGDASVPLSQMFSAGITFLKSQPSVLLLGLAQSTFEGGMYAFVFMWSPALIAATKAALGVGVDVDILNQVTLPFGLIFATFMVSVMIGSYIFGFSSSKFGVAAVPYIIHIVSAIAMLIVSLSTSSQLFTFLAFLTFEAMVGMFWPTYGTLRSIYIPENCRASISNLFRVPLNAFVLTLLLNSDNLPVNVMFGICAAAHTISAVLYFIFQKMHIKNDDKKNE